MVRLQSFVAVNEAPKDSSAEQETQEARESRVISQYEVALRCMQRREVAEAQAAFRGVLADQVVQAAASEQMQRIKFLALKHMGALLTETSGAAAEALECYVAACELQDNDVVLWNRMGTLASESGFWALARHAFERGLQCSPAHPTMRAKLHLLLSHVGAAALAGTPSAPGPAAHRSAPAQLAHAGGLLRLPDHSTVPDGPPQPPLALPGAPPATLQLADASWAALLSCALDCSSPLQPNPALVHLSLPASTAYGAAAAGCGPQAAAACTPGKPGAGGLQAGAAPTAASGAGAGLAEEVVRLVLTPGKAGKPASAAAAAESAATPGAQLDAASEHVAVELLVQQEPPGLADAQQQEQQQQQQGEEMVAAQDQEGVAATPADLEQPAGAAAASTRPQRRRRSTGKRAQQQQQQQQAAGPGASAEEHRASLFSLAEVLGMAEGSEQDAAGGNGEQGAAAAAGAAAGAEAGPVAAAGLQLEQAAGPSAQGYVSTIPEGGLHPTQLLCSLLEHLTAAPEAAAALSGAERALLLKVAGRVEQEGEAWRLQAACCLTLAELCIIGAAGSSPAAGGHGPKGPNGQKPGRVATQPGDLRDCGKPRGKGAAPAAHADQALQLRQDGGQWLVRYLAASCAARFGGGDGSKASAGGQEPPAAATAAAGVEAAERTQEAAAPSSASLPTAAVRYWWARGQLEEAAGAATQASRLYERCLQALQDSGLTTIPLPHWPQLGADGQPCGPALAITEESIRGKLEVLQLHDMVLSAEQHAQREEPGAVVAALEPVLLTCGPKEGSMAALDAQQWQHALGLLLESALDQGAHWLAAACQLRLAWHALAPLSPGVEGRSQAGGDKGDGAPDAVEAAATKAVRAALSSGAVGALTHALEDAMRFFHAHVPSLQLQQAGQGRDRQWSDWEWQLLQRVQRRLVGVVEGCRAVLVAAAGSSYLSLQASSLRRTMAAAASLVVHLWELAPAAQHSTQSALTLLRALCEALGEGHALLELEGAFAVLCVEKLQAVMAAAKSQHGQDLSDDDNESTEAWEYWDLKCGLHSCLYWLYGITLPGREDEPWAESFEAPSLAERLLSSPQACLSVWGLVREHLMDLDDKELHSFEEFIQLVAAQFRNPPPAALRYLDAAWERLEAQEPPDELLPSSIDNPLEPLWHEAGVDLVQALVQQQQQQPHGSGLAELVTEEAMDVEGAAPGGGALGPSVPAAAAAAAAAGEGLQGGGEEPGAAAAAAAEGAAAVVAEEAAARAAEEAHRAEQEAEEDRQYLSVRSSLYRLLAVQHMDMQKAMAGVSILSPEAEAAVENLLAPCKYDLLYNPACFVGWEQLAISYHETADWVLEEATTSIPPQAWASGQHTALRRMYERFRHMGHQCGALALKYADDNDDRAQLLVIMGDRVYSDLQKVPPFYDHLRASHPTPADQQQEQQQQQRQDACWRALHAFQAAEPLLPDDWELQLRMGRCLRKLGRHPSEWLPALAHACHLATSRAGGMLDAVYALHAARLKLILSARSVLLEPDAALDEAAVDEAAHALELAGHYCFLQGTQQALAQTLQQGGCGGKQPAAEEPAAGALVAAAGQQGDVEMLDGGLAAGGGSGHEPPHLHVGEAGLSPVSEGMMSPADAMELLQRDCLEALKWCQQKDKQYHRATYRLAEAKLATEGRAAALQELAPLFSKPPKQLFCINITQVTATEAPEAAPAGRKRRKGARSGRAHEDQSPKAEQGAVPESDWGMCPEHVSGAGQEESIQQYYGSVRRCLKRYLQLLAEEGQLETLKAAGAFLTTNSSWGPSAVPSFQDMRQLTAGSLVLCMLGSMGQICPLARLLSLLRTAEPPAAVGADLASGTSRSELAPQPPQGNAAAGAAGSASAGSHKEDGWERVHSELRTLSQELEASTATLGLLESLYQFWAEHSLRPREDSPGWAAEVLAPGRMALAAAEPPEGLPELRQALDKSEQLLRAYAELYLLLLGKMGNWEKLLLLLKPLKPKPKAAQQPSEAVQRHVALACQEALAALRRPAEEAWEEAVKLRPELAPPPPPPPPSQQQQWQQAQAQPRRAQQAQQAPPAQPVSQRVATAMLSALSPEELQSYVAFLAGLETVDAAAAMRCVADPAQGVVMAMQNQQLPLSCMQRVAAAMGEAQKYEQQQQELVRQQQLAIQQQQQQVANLQQQRHGGLVMLSPVQQGRAAQLLISSSPVGPVQHYSNTSSTQPQRQQAAAVMLSGLQQQQQRSPLLASAWGVQLPPPLPQPPLQLPLQPHVAAQALQALLTSREQQAYQQLLLQIYQMPPPLNQTLVQLQSQPALGVDLAAKQGLISAETATRVIPALNELAALQAGLIAAPASNSQERTQGAAATAQPPLGMPVQPPSPAAAPNMPPATAAAAAPVQQGVGALAQGAAVLPSAGAATKVVAAAAADAAPPAAPAATAAQQDIPPAASAEAEGAAGEAGSAALAAPGPAPMSAPPSGAEAGAASGPAAAAAANQGPATGAAGPQQPPCPEPLTLEESRLDDRVVAVLRGMRELQKVVTAAIQSAGGKADASQVGRNLKVLQKEVSRLPSRLYEVHAALNRIPGPPTTRAALLKLCDELLRQHRRLSQRGIQPPAGGDKPSAAVAAAGEVDPVAVAAAGDGGGAAADGGRKRGPSAGREGSAGSDGAGEVPGSTRKRARREAAGLAATPAKQLAPGAAVPSAAAEPLASTAAEPEADSAAIRDGALHKKEMAAEEGEAGAEAGGDAAAAASTALDTPARHNAESGPLAGAEAKLGSKRPLGDLEAPGPAAAGDGRDAPGGQAASGGSPKVAEAERQHGSSPSPQQGGSPQEGSPSSEGHEAAAGVDGLSQPGSTCKKPRRLPPSRGRGGSPTAAQRMFLSAGGLAGD